MVTPISVCVWPAHHCTTHIRNHTERRASQGRVGHPAKATAESAKGRRRGSAVMGNVGTLDHQPRTSAPRNGGSSMRALAPPCIPPSYPAD